MRSLFLRLYLLLTLTFIGLGWSIDKFYSSLHTESQFTSDLALHQGTLMLLNAELIRQSQAGRQAHLAALATSFGYPLALLNQQQVTALADATGLSLNQEQHDYLYSGGTVSLFNEALGQSWFLKKLSDGQSVILLGPILTESAANTDIYYTGLFFLGLAIFVFLWAWPISSGLASLTKAATAFGRGDFAVRATAKVSSPLKELVERFNAMAARIQRLIKSHKELSHAVSHELRTPIARIRFAMEIIRDEHDIELKNKYLDTMDESIEELDGLVDELLVYAKFDREEPELKFVSVDLRQMVGEIIEKYQLTEPNYQFSLVANKKLFANIDTDGIGKVVDNLLRNAVKYAKQNIQVSLSTVQTASKDTRIILTVEDDGKGIPSENWHTIFEPFVRLDKSRDRKSGGIGLGLAIVKRFVELHQGQVSVKKSPLGGVAFVVNLPLANRK